MPLEQTLWTGRRSLEVTQSSLLPNRRQDSLGKNEVEQIKSFCAALAYPGILEFETDSGSKTRFEVRHDEDTGTPYGVIVVGPDIYPGKHITNPNSILCAFSAVAHEVTHYFRWFEFSVLPLGHLDEAITSLQATCRFRNFLSPTQIEALVSDAMQRLEMLRKEFEEKDNG